MTKTEQRAKSIAIKKEIADDYDGEEITTEEIDAMYFSRGMEGGQWKFHYKTIVDRANEIFNSNVTLEV